MMTLSERIRVLRGERTFAQFAKITRLSAQTLHAAEHDKSIRIGTLRQIANACKVAEGDWISLIILWIRTEIGERDFLKLDMAPRGSNSQNIKHGHLYIADVVLSLFSKLTNEDQEQILKAMARPSVRQCLPAINRQYEIPTVSRQSLADNEVIEDVTRGLRAGDILFCRVGANSERLPQAAFRKSQKKRP